MKKIFVKDETQVMNTLKKGVKVAGRLSLVEMEDGRMAICFEQYNRTRHPESVTLRVLETGWVKESRERIRIYESIPKAIGTARMMTVVDREAREVKNALMDRELIDFI